MKKKGFTLIELLGVVVILGILTLIAFPPILNQIKKSKNEIKNSTKTLIIDAAKDYYENNINNYDKIEGITYCVNINILIEQGYLNDKLKDENINNIDRQKKVKIIYHNNKNNYDVTDTCNNNVLTRNDIEVPIVSENDGLYKSQIDQNKFIYRGANPNNYISLKENGENVLYRILSYENDGTIKVVRNESIGKIKWDDNDARKNNKNTYCDTSNGCNVWGKTENTYYENKTLPQIFNYKYYDNSASVKLEDYSLKRGTVTQEATLNTYLNNTWLNETGLESLITPHEYNVGEVYYKQTYEGGDKGIFKEKEEEKIYNWNGKVGLLSITEFVETSTNSACTSVYSNFRYNYPIYYYKAEGETSKTEHPPTNDNYPCKSNNWNMKSYNQYAITTAHTATDAVWYIHSRGYFFIAYANSTTTANRPAFYLKATTKLTGGGTESNPYRIL